MPLEPSVPHPDSKIHRNPLFLMDPLADPRPSITDSSFHHDQLFQERPPAAVGGRGRLHRF